MPSPFPGMDPYIEQLSLWGDFHINLAVQLRTNLTAHIRPDYFARLLQDGEEYPFCQLSVEIYATVANELITVIEIPSPTNKFVGHGDYIRYMEKRRRIIETTQVNLVEIDLLRIGKRLPLTESVPNAPYYVMLHRAGAKPRESIWPIQLQDMLPTIPIPLRHPTPDVMLNLGSAVTSAYHNGAYDVQLDYNKPVPPPALSKEQQAWVDQLLHTTK